MAHFYGTIAGAGTSEATRTGTKKGGLRATALSDRAKVSTHLRHVDGEDFVEIYAQNKATGLTITFYDGSINELLDLIRQTHEG